jgi:3-phenylpropionate/trans-cinnamate dioxygenase ferredoxin reductase subunit
METQNSERIIEYLIIGGGLAGATAAEKLRAKDLQSSIVIVSNERVNPYHRPPLSKEYLRGEIGADGVYGEGGVYVQPANWYQDKRIELIENTEAQALDTRARTVRLANGQTLHFHNLLLATGGRPRTLKIPGADLPGVHLLRTLDDSNALREQIGQGKRIVAVGAGFIGLEVAASALTKGAQITIVEPQERIWTTTVSPEVAQFFQHKFEQNGATLHYKHSAVEFVAGQDGRLASVRIASVDSKDQTEEIPCDLAVVGVGIQLNTELAASGGLDVDPHNGIIVDEHLETKVEGIFAAGDVAAYPDPFVGRMHFEHWDNAIASAEIAADNMRGEDDPYRHLPYFFSDQFDLSINMLGYPSSQDPNVIRGDLKQGKFTAFYVKDGELRAALMVNDDAQMDLIRQLITQGAPVSDIKQLANPAFDLNTLVQD